MRAGPPRCWCGGHKVVGAGQPHNLLLHHVLRGGRLPGLAAGIHVQAAGAAQQLRHRAAGFHADSKPLYYGGVGGRIKGAGCVAEALETYAFWYGSLVLSFDENQIAFPPKLPVLGQLT